MIKIFVNDSKLGGDLYTSAFETIANGEKLEITAQSGSLIQIPRGYDLYLIHLRDITDEEEIKRLRLEQPSSEIVYTSLCGTPIPFIRTYCDEIAGFLDLNDLKRLLKNSKLKQEARVKK